jgi:hypothetical protein
LKLLIRPWAAGILFYVSTDVYIESFDYAPVTAGTVFLWRMKIPHLCSVFAPFWDSESILHLLMRSNGKPTMNTVMRKHALQRYLVLRVKLIEFFDFASLRQNIKDGKTTVFTPVNRLSSDFVGSIRTVQLSWLALLIDKSKGG